MAGGHEKGLITSADSAEYHPAPASLNRADRARRKISGPMMENDADPRHHPLVDPRAGETAWFSCRMENRRSMAKRQQRQLYAGNCSAARQRASDEFR